SVHTTKPESIFPEGKTSKSTRPTTRFHEQVFVRGVKQEAATQFKTQWRLDLRFLLQLRAVLGSKLRCDAGGFSRAFDLLRRILRRGRRLLLRRRRRSWCIAISGRVAARWRVAIGRRLALRLSRRCGRRLVTIGRRRGIGRRSRCCGRIASRRSRRGRGARQIITLQLVKDRRYLKRHLVARIHGRIPFGVEHVYL